MSDLGLGTALTHAIDRFREGEVRKDTGGCVVPRLNRWVEVAIKSCLIHRVQDFFQARFATVFIAQPIALGPEERHRGGGASLTPPFEHLRDRAEAAVDVFEGEVITIGWPEQGEDQQSVEIELEHVGLVIFLGVQSHRVAEHLGVRGRAFE